VAIVLLALAATWTAFELSAEPAQAPQGQLACLDLVGGTAGRAEDILRRRGYEVKWSLLRYEPPDGSMFSQTDSISVPATSIVDEIEATGARTATVFVHAADDTYAPVPKPVPCP
jgi:hypothetical protein